MAKNNAFTLRIIGGKWRGRKFRFPDDVAIRPTPDRIRETLFNWLQFDINNAVCLDCFAGSGALGFEALSRGAKQVVMLDKQANVIRQLTKIKKELNVKGAEIQRSQFPNYMPQLTQKFSIIFLDPPFQQDFIEKCIPWLEENINFADNSFIYIEVERALKTLEVPAHWQQLKAKQAGNVRYYLYQRMKQEEK